MTYDEKCMADSVWQCMGKPEVVLTPAWTYPPCPGNPPTAFNTPGVVQDSVCFAQAYKPYHESALRYCQQLTQLRPPAHCERRMLTERGWRDVLREDQNNLVQRLETLCLAAGGAPVACKDASAAWLPPAVKAVADPASAATPKASP